jgi:hypothetical protein
MSEAEVKLERRPPAAMVLIMLVALTFALVGLAGYLLSKGGRAPTPAEVTSAVTSALKSQGPTAVSFHTGTVAERSDESPRDARYRLLEKTGIIKAGESTGSSVAVVLTSKGREVLSRISGVKKTDEADGNAAYVVPLASMQLVDISEIQMTGKGRATVQFTWRWEPNVLGSSFDASSTLMRGFNSQDRTALMDKYGVRFYRQSPTKAVVAVMKTARGWEMVSE